MSTQVLGNNEQFCVPGKKNIFLENLCADIEYLDVYAKIYVNFWYIEICFYGIFLIGSYVLEAKNTTS
jgi:hypothetical protein